MADTSVSHGLTLNSGTSLWLVPPPDVAAKLNRIMRRKTPTSKSPSSFPPFAPHITLCTVPSSMDTSELCSAVPKDQPVMPVTFKAVEVGSKYFMSVYVTVPHVGALDSLRESLKTTLGERTVPPISHVSLFYIDDSEPEEREKMASELRNEGRVIELGEDRVALDCAEVPSGDPTSPDVVSGFIGGEIWVAVCDGPVPGWTVKEIIRLRAD